MKLEYAACSDPGRVRAINEDRVWAQDFAASEGEPFGLFVVCDGLGGHQAGEMASYWAVETVKQELASYFAPRNPRATVLLSEEDLQANPNHTRPVQRMLRSEIAGQIRRAVEKANQVVIGYAHQKPLEAADAGTTITMAFIWGNLGVIANVGDSRTYLLRDHRLRQVTQDHSLVATMVASGQIRPGDVYTHPQRNVIYRSLGQKRKVEVDLFQETLQPGDALLLCSDGLWEMIPDEGKLVQVIESAPDPEKACQALVDLANKAGGEDNISAIIVRIK